MADATHLYLHGLARDCFLLSLAGYGAIGASFLAAVFDEDPLMGTNRVQEFFGIEPLHTLVRILMLGSAAAWACWALMGIRLTGPSPASEARDVASFRRATVLRHVTRASQFLWPLAALLAWWATTQDHRMINGLPTGTLLGFEQDQVRLAAALIRVGAVIGSGLLAWHLSRLADWGNDTALAWRFNAVAFGLSGAGTMIVVLTLLTAATESFVFVMLSAVFWVLFLVSLWLFALALIQLPKLATSAVSSRQAAIERDKRLAEKARKEREAARKGERSPFETRRTIAESTPCLGCGYDVRGMTMGQQCPECGHRIGTV